ncbi:MAG: hypothetical protein WCP52_12270 [Bacteroidota bacterium]
MTSPPAPLLRRGVTECEILGVFDGMLNYRVYYICVCDVWQWIRKNGGKAMMNGLMDVMVWVVCYLFVALW